MSQGRVEVIGLHQWTDLDPLMALALMLRYKPQAGQAFPGLKLDMPVKFFPAGIEVEPKPGLLLLDAGQGPEDHHNGDSQGVCTMDLVAYKMGIYNLPELQLVLSRVRDHDLQGRDIYGNGHNEVLKAVSIVNLINGCHLREKQQKKVNERDPSKPVPNYKMNVWRLVRAMEAVVYASQNLAEFRKSGHWIDDVKDAYARLLWEKYDNLRDGTISVPSLATVIKIFDQSFYLESGRESTFSQIMDSGDSKVHKFLLRDQWFNGKKTGFDAEAAAFSICGIGFGLSQIEINREKRLELLQIYLDWFSAVDSDWELAMSHVKDWLTGNPPRCRAISIVPQKGKQFRIGAVVSNHVKAGPALRYLLKVDVTINFRNKPTKQYQITVSANQFMQQRLYLCGIVLRMAECIVRQRSFKQSELEVMRNCELVPEIFISPCDGKIDQAFLVANGTHKNTEVPSTHLTRATVLRIVQNVFFFGTVPAENVVKAIVRIGQEEEGWPHDSERPGLFRDVRTPIEPAVSEDKQ